MICAFHYYSLFVVYHVFIIYPENPGGHCLRMEGVTTWKQKIQLNSWECLGSGGR